MGYFLFIAVLQITCYGSRKRMSQTIVTPFFLDQHVTGLELLAGPGTSLNAPKLLPGGRMARMSVIHKPLADFVERGIHSESKIVSIAGDCCSTLAVLAGLQRASLDPMLIWFDAHGDFNTWKTSPSGFIGGMPLAMIVGRGEQALAQPLRLEPLSESRVILSDARDLDPAEGTALRQSNVTHFPDVTSLLEMEIPSDPLYIHFDTDIVSSEESPAQNYPAAGGPSSEVIRAVFRRLRQNGRIVAVSVSTWNPDLDRDGHSRRVSMSLLGELI